MMTNGITAAPAAVEQPGAVPAGAPQPNPPAPDKPPVEALPDVPTKPAQGEGRKVISMPSDEVAKIRNREREKGRKAALAENEKKAKELGFSSYDAMLAAAAAARGKGKPAGKPAVPAKGKPAAEAAPAQAAPPKPPAGAAKTPSERRLAQLEQERIQLRRKAADADKRRRLMQREMTRKEVDLQLRWSAHEAGIRGEANVDYALHLLRHEYRNRTKDELQGFDEAQFFSGLRKSYPILFGVEQRPATSGVSDEPEVKSSAKPQPPATSEPPKDGKQMTQEQYLKRLEALGIKNPSTNYSQH